MTGHAAKLYVRRTGFPFIAKEALTPLSAIT
jgi:hypothetical protein